MKIKGSHTTTTYVEVDIDPMDALRKLEELMKTAHGFPVDAYVDKQGRIVQDEEHYTSHSWTTTAVLNDTPTNEQLYLFQSIDSFRKHLAISLDVSQAKKESLR